MKSALCAILFTVLVASSSQAGYVGQINLASGSGAQGSLGNALDGLGSVIVGTNIAAPSITAMTTPGSSPIPIGGYFDFNTGAYAGTDASGNSVYASGGNFFVLDGTLPTAANTPPLASSLTLGQATVKTLGMSTSTGDPEYELTMGFSGGYLNQALSADLGMPALPLATGRVYTGSIDFIFVNDSALGGSQLLSGTISFNGLSPQDVPEPASLVLVALGGLGLAGYGRYRKTRQTA